MQMFFFVWHQTSLRAQKTHHKQWKKKVASVDWFPFLQTNSPWPEPSTHRHQVHEFQRSHIGRHWCSWRPRLSHVCWNPSGCSSFIYPRHLVKVSLKKIRCQITSNQHIPIFCWPKFQKYQDHPFMVKDFFPWNPSPEKYPSNQTGHRLTCWSLIPPPQQEEAVKLTSFCTKFPCWNDGNGPLKDQGWIWS